MTEIRLHVDGREVTVDDDAATLLEVLRDRLGVRSPKDGCSPQGQCGCCTVLVDGQPRVSCVTPVRRVAGRVITTADGLPDGVRTAWSEALCATGGSQCGFCTPGIVCRLAGLAAKEPDLPGPAVEKALQAHLCRCTGWQTIVEAAALVGAGDPVTREVGASLRGRDPAAARRRATLEGGAPQQVGPEVSLGHAGFADDTAPAGALVAVPDGVGGWVVGETLAAARAAAGKVQGRNTTAPTAWPVEAPAGEWARTLVSTWTEPAYLETDASWCDVSGDPVSPLANGGAFGAKRASVVIDAAQRLAREHGRPVRVLLSREDVVRLGPKRPPMAVALRADGTGVVRVRRTPGLSELLGRLAPGLVVDEVDLPGPPTSLDLRGAGWLEPLVALGSLGRRLDGSDAGDGWVTAPSGGRARATVGDDGSIQVQVEAGELLDAVVLRSYAIGAAHQALGLVTSEAIALDGDGSPRDLTIRSFGVLRALDTPRIDVDLVAGEREAVNGSEAVLAAVALAVWQARGFAPRWPASS